MRPKRVVKLSISRFRAGCLVSAAIMDLLDQYRIDACAQKRVVELSICRFHTGCLVSAAIMDCSLPAQAPWDEVGLEEVLRPAHPGV